MTTQALKEETGRYGGLVLRLRQASSSLWGPNAIGTIECEAATAISSLETEVKELREALWEAEVIIRDYAAQNPRWTANNGQAQDPLGAHAWIDERIAARTCTERKT